MKRESDIIISLIARATFAESYIRSHIFAIVKRHSASDRRQTSLYSIEKVEEKTLALISTTSALALTTHARSHARTLGSLGAHVRIFNDSRRISEGD